MSKEEAEEAAREVTPDRHRPHAPAINHPLRTERCKQEMTQSQLAKLAHVAVRSVQHVEAGRRWPHSTTRRRLLRALGLTMRDAPRIFPCTSHRWASAGPYRDRCVRCGAEVTA